MKLSAKKRGQIYDLVHEKILKKRLEIISSGIIGNKHLADKIDYLIAQLEIPIAQGIMGLLDEDYKKGLQ